MKYLFSEQQRRVMDRYICLLGTLVPLHDKANLVFERRRKEGHQRAELTYDFRLNKAASHERYLRGYLERVESVRIRTSACVEELRIFARESLEITRRTSKGEAINQIDVNCYSFTRSPKWNSSPPTSVGVLVHALGSFFFDVGGHFHPMKYMLNGAHEDSFGLEAAFTKIMGWRSCGCHTQPTVAQELFMEPATTPVWDLAYSSSDLSIKAKEYEAGVTQLFVEFVLLNTQMGVFIEEILQRVESVNTELVQTAHNTTMGRLNSTMETVLQSAEELMMMLEHIEAWLRK